MDYVIKSSLMDFINDKLKIAKKFLDNKLFSKIQKKNKSIHRRIFYLKYFY